MNPVQLSQALQETLVRYLSTTFNVNRDGREPELANALRTGFETPGALFHGPYLELTPPYRTGKSLENLCAEGILPATLRDMECFQRGQPLPLNIPLFLHQETAIRKLCSENRNVVVSSGTGSGKTECFLIPILSDLLFDPSPGVRALLIYPMNALVNDQLERLRSLLVGTGITFGRYTSELPNTMNDVVGHDFLPNEVVCREQIRTNQVLPQILITNYAMLEYLLLRPEDSPLFSSGTWRFVVLDEAHTYTGAQGVEVSMLLRRLKHRLGHEPGTTRCVATSATLTADDAGSTAIFASRLFGEQFDNEDVIFGEIDPDYFASPDAQHEVPPEVYLHDDFETLLSEVRKDDAQDTRAVALSMQQIGLIDESLVNHADRNQMSVQAFLWKALNGNTNLIALRDWLAEIDGPVEVTEAARRLFGTFTAEDRIRALYHLVELGAAARPSMDRSPLLPARYHLFARAPQGIWVCLNPQCPGRLSSEQAHWSRISAVRQKTCEACGCVTYPLSVCRTCGQVYIRTEYQDRQYLPEANQLEAFSVRYFTWAPIEENLALADVEEDEELAATQSANQQLEERILCLRCQREAALCQCGPAAVHTLLYLVENIETDKRMGSRPVPAEAIDECCRCHDHSAIKDSEVVTPISIAGSTPLAIIVNALYRQLPPSTNSQARSRPGEGRKLLSFYDSRQGAARFAAFLQDSVNTQTYRHILPKAAREVWEEQGWWPDLDRLSDKAVEMAWQLRIFHNDPFLGNVGEQKTLSRPQRKQLREHIEGQIIAEFTTGRRSRQSLESLGLLAVEYFEEGREPDFEDLAMKLHVPADAARILVENLIDGLRAAKIVTLPDGVLADDEIFGRNKFSPRLVRSRPNVSQHEIPWIGATSRHRRNQYMRSILEYFHLPAEEEHIRLSLGTIFDWLIDKADVLTGSPEDGYQLDHTRLFFNVHTTWWRCWQCQRFSPHGGVLPCPYPHCGGRLEQVQLEDVRSEDFFMDLFQQSIIPMRVEEHTAQLDSIKGREYQDAFKGGGINVLSCSTTFEMGIDLGDLQAIALCNVPPSVANYRQRAGRAGRRAGGTAFILTWASDRPHDQSYFNDPPEIIRGYVRVPHLALENPFIRRRHVNAILFSRFLRYLRDSGVGDIYRVGSFFDPQSPDGPSYDRLSKWTSLRRNDIIQEISDFAPAIEMIHDPIVSQWLTDFQDDMREASSHYQTVTNYYRNESQVIAASIQQAGGRAAPEMTDSLRRYQRLLDRFNDEHLIDFLSNRGVLPSYSFPLHTVELTLPFGKGDHLRLQRDLRQAIREYAPGSEVVADKRLWRSSGLEFFRQTPKVWYYRICRECNHLQIGPDAGVELPSDGNTCPICGSGSHRRAFRFVEPDGFQSDPRSGQPAGQYVRREPNLMRSGLLPRQSVNEERLGLIVHSAYERQGKLLYVNEGVLSQGFRICSNCGRTMGRGQVRCKAKTRGQLCDGAVLDGLMLGHLMQTDLLRLRFASTPDIHVPGPDDSAFWYSLMYALLQGASRVLQIERRDLDGVLAPRALENGAWQQTIALYDNVPGGAGHVKRIQDEFASVVSEALKIVNCSSCTPETSCYNCLRDYSNQTYHHLLERGRILRFLEILRDSLELVESTVPGAGQVVAMNLPRWLIQQVDQTRHSLVMAVDEVTRRSPSGESRMWLEVIQELLHRGVGVDLILTDTPELNDGDPEKLSVARHMQFLIGKEENPLRIWLADRLPGWQFVLDAYGDTAVQRAIAVGFNERLILDQNIGQQGMVTTIHSEGVQLAKSTMDELSLIPLTTEMLNPPPGVRVLNLPRRSLPPDTEETLFGDLFSKPVRELVINDRYLYDHERIVNRVGAYVGLATRGQELQRVTVFTQRAGQHGAPGTSRDQDSAIHKLRQVTDAQIEFKYGQASHDRYVLLKRADGTQARILIGRGLDFINPDGRISSTYVVIEDLL